MRRGKGKIGEDGLGAIRGTEKFDQAIGKDLRRIAASGPSDRCAIKAILGGDLATAIFLALVTPEVVMRTLQQGEALGEPPA
jgi:hypothetical protein